MLDNKPHPNVSIIGAFYSTHTHTAACTHSHRFRNIRYAFNMVMLLIALQLLYQKSKIARDLWQTFVGLCLHSLAKLSIPYPYSWP